MLYILVSHLLSYAAQHFAPPFNIPYCHGPVEMHFRLDSKQFRYCCFCTNIPRFLLLLSNMVCCK